mgnify:CR=1 FL=1
MKRVPKNYRGTRPTAKTIGQILPPLLGSIGASYNRRGDALLATWPEVVGKDVASMTRARSFIDGVLRVSVSNSTLLSLLTEHEKPRLIRELNKRVPQAGVKAIQFFIG